MKNSIDTLVRDQEKHIDTTPGATVIRIDTPKKNQSEDKGNKKARMNQLKEEVIAIKLANSKVADAEARGIPKTAIADNISMAHQSIPDRVKEIEQLKKSLHTGSTKNFLHKAAVVLGAMVSMFTAKESIKKETAETKLTSQTETTI